MAQFESLFGSKLRAAGGAEVATKDELAGADAVGIYFSAHWCPPCRGFTPKLAEIYTDLTKNRGLRFKIVFVSSDRDESAFDEYHGEMPWPALPFADRDLKDKLSKKYKVQGIPTLVIVDHEGNTLTTDGRSTIMEDPEGKDFPWAPPSFAESIGDTFVNGKGEKVSYSSLDGKVLGLYFSAHWCPPCKAFTPKLAETYKALQAAGKDFEIVFVSSDRDEHAFKEYFGEMPWLALPYEARDKKNKLSKLFNVEGIPTFVILDTDRSVITANGRGAVGGDPKGEEFPWHPKPVGSLASPDGINETPSLVLFAEKASKDTQKELIEALTLVAEPIMAKAKETKADPEIIFFASTEHSEVASKVRKLTGLKESDHPQLVLLDIPDQGGYYEFKGTEVSFNSVTEFLQQYKDKALTRKQLS